MAAIDKNQISDMIDICERMLERSYCVYSRFPVAAVLLTECGMAITGK